MANFSRQERTTKHVEYRVPKGNVMGEFDKADRAAWHEYCRLNDQDPATARRWDNWAEVDADDEHVIIRFEIEKVTA